MSTMSTRPVLLKECQIVQLIHKLFGIHVTFVSQLESYQDRNYLVRTQTSTSDTDNQCFVLKILNSMEKQDCIDIQNDVILHLKQAGFPLPAPLQTLEGSYVKLMPFETIDGSTTECCLVRLFEFLPGTTLEKIKLTKSLCHEIGHYAGLLDKILQTHHKFDDIDVSKIMVGIFNLSKVPDIRTHVDIVIEDPKRRDMIKGVITIFEEDVLKNESKFFKGYIHNDVHDYNLLVSKEPKSSYCIKLADGKDSHDGQSNEDVDNNVDEDYHISGVIDFGDMTYSCYVFEVAIAIGHAVTNKSGLPPFEAGGCILVSYLKHIELSDFELKRLKICVCARLVQAITIGLVTLKANPDNEYVMEHCWRMWKPLELFWPMDDDDFLQQMIQAGK